MQPKVLLIADSLEDRQSVIEALRHEDCRVETLSGCANAMATMEQWISQFDAVIIKEAAQTAKSLELFHATRSKRSDLPVIVVTRDGNWESY